MQGGIIDHWTEQQGIAVLFQRDLQTLEPIGPLTAQMALDPDLKDPWLPWIFFLVIAPCLYTLSYRIHDQCT